MEKITSVNLIVCVKYLKAAKALNRYVKDSFNKTEQQELSIAEILPELHQEMGLMEIEVQRYLKAHATDYIHKDGYYHGYFNEPLDKDEYYIHLIDFEGKNKLNVEFVRFNKRDDGTYYDIKISRHLIDHKKELDILYKDRMIYNIIDGVMSECTKEEFDDAIERYKQISEIHLKTMKS